MSTGCVETLFGGEFEHRAAVVEFDDDVGVYIHTVVDGCIFLSQFTCKGAD